MSETTTRISGEALEAGIRAAELSIFRCLLSGWADQHLAAALRELQERRAATDPTREALQAASRALWNAAVELAGQDVGFCRACGRSWSEGRAERHNPDCPVLLAETARAQVEAVLSGSCEGVG